MLQQIYEMISLQQESVCSDFTGISVPGRCRPNGVSWREQAVGKVKTPHGRRQKETLPQFLLCEGWDRSSDGLEDCLLVQCYCSPRACLPRAACSAWVASSTSSAFCLSNSAHGLALFVLRSPHFCILCSPRLPTCLPTVGHPTSGARDSIQTEISLGSWEKHSVALSAYSWKK